MIETAERLRCHQCALGHVWDHRTDGFLGVPVELCDTEFDRAITIHVCHCTAVLAVTVVTEDGPNIVLVPWEALHSDARDGCRPVSRCPECNRAHFWSRKSADFRTSLPERVVTPTGREIGLHVCPRPCSAVLALAVKKTGTVYTPWSEDPTD